MTSASSDTTAYQYLSSVYDRWNLQADYEGWCDFIWEMAGLSVGQRLLDVCCGTGTMMAMFRRRGLVVDGVDGSPEMLAEAQRKLGASDGLYHARLPLGDPPAGPYRAAICTFDSLNYLSGTAELGETITSIASRLGPEATLIFDVNTRRKLEDVFGNTHWGDDLGDFAYVWRNRSESSSRQTEFLISLFRRNTSGAFERLEERHVQRWFTRGEIEDVCSAAGLRVDQVLDDYSRTESSETTLRETWVLRKI